MIVVAWLACSPSDEVVDADPPAAPVLLVDGVPGSDLVAEFGAAADAACEAIDPEHGTVPGATTWTVGEILVGDSTPEHPDEFEVSGFQAEVLLANDAWGDAWTDCRLLWWATGWTRGRLGPRGILETELSLQLDLAASTCPDAVEVVASSSRAAFMARYTVWSDGVVLLSEWWAPIGTAIRVDEGFAYSIGPDCVWF